MSADMMAEELKQLPIPKLHDVVITRTETFGKVRFEAIPPEEFLIQRRAKTLADAHFLCHRTTKTRSELVEMGFDHDIVYSLAAETTQRYNTEKSTRHRNIDDDFTKEVGDSSTDEIPICESYIRIDEDGDGQPHG